MNARFRGRDTLFPERLIDWLGENDPAQVIHLFVDEVHPSWVTNTHSAR